MKPMILGAVLAIAASPAVMGESVTVSPGTLSSAIPNPQGVTALTVSGAVNAADFEFLRSMPNLKSLDLSGAAIAAYDGDRLAHGAVAEEANRLPDCALMGSPVEALALPASLRSIGAGALGGTNVTNLVIPDGVTTIQEGAFSNMTGLKSLTIPASVTSLPVMMLKDCTSLESVTVNADVAAIPAQCFSGCTALTSVTLPQSVKTIGDNAFAGCSALEGVTLPAGVTGVGDRAFANTGLTSLSLPSTVTAIGEWAFASCPNLRSVGAPANLKHVGEGAFYICPTLEVSLGDLAAHLDSVPAYLLYGDKAAVAGNFAVTPVAHVGEYALSGVGVDKLALPATLVSLGDNAMERMDNLTEIDALALREVPSLGENVWAEVDQEGVRLKVLDTMVDIFKAAPQWNDFKIEGEASDLVDTPVADATPITATFLGTTLRVEAGKDIRALQLYDIAGRLYTIVQGDRSLGGTANVLEVETAPYDTPVYLIRIILADGEAASIKLHRK